MHVWGWFASTTGPMITTLLLAECTELSPWLARKVIKAGAHLLLDPQQVARYEAEWTAILAETPGKLTVLLRAVGIVVLAVPRMNWDYFDCVWVCTIGLQAFTFNIYRQLKCPWYERFCEQHRAAAGEYNRNLQAACYVLRNGTPAERSEVLRELESLIQDPPPWVAQQPGAASLLRWTIGRDLPHFRQSLRRRGLLAPAE